MANKFTAGMKNVVEVLNQMWVAFAAGPYNALPLTGGVLVGPVISFSSISAMKDGAPAPGDASTMIQGPMHGAGRAASLVATFGVGGSAGLSYPGQFRWYTSSGRPGPNGTYGVDAYDLFLRAISLQDGTVEGPDLLVIRGNREISLPGVLKVGVNNAEPQGTRKLDVANCAVFTVVGGNYGAPASCALNISANNITGRSMNAGGTVNASGADYAEYLTKSTSCGTLAKGQIVGIDADGRLTDKWDRAITFVVKSTNPCMVGGDSWAQHLGARPAAPVRIAPTVEQVLVTPGVPADVASGTEAVPPVYGSTTTAPGDTDDEWAAKQAAHEAALAAFETELEAARQTVDRIAFAGQVPVNIQGATPGQYIVPVRHGDGISGIAVDADDMTVKQYMRAIGKVIAIEDDGRARIIVKVA